MNNDVVFRRIGGRIVPIRRKAGEYNKLPREKKVEAAKGAAIATGGVALSAGAGFGYKKTMLHFLGKDTAARNIIKGMDDAALKAGQLNLFTHGPEFAKNTAQAEKLFKQSQKLAKFGAVVRWAAPLAGAGIIAYGANRFSNATSKNRKKIKKAAILGTAGSLAGGAFYYGMYGKKGIKEAFVKHALPRIKDLIKKTTL